MIKKIKYYLHVLRGHRFKMHRRYHIDMQDVFLFKKSITYMTIYRCSGCERLCLDFGNGARFTKAARIVGKKSGLSFEEEE